ncbi:MAG: F-box protein [Solitalea-like symbiont of Tyrophagus putrescentiae]
MPKRPYSQISSPETSLSKLSTTTTTTSMTDLPVDVLCLVFKRLPLFEVLRNQSLVCKLFYDAHLQHCRSSVKHLTLFGHYLLKDSPIGPVKPQKEVVCKQMLFKYSRGTSSISSLATINPSSSHLKLVAGLEESAYSAIGTKFQSVTSLELFQLPLERHYKPITAMINAWGGRGEEEEKKKGKKKKKVTAGGGDGQISATANQLTELKIFFSKEIYNLEGKHLK